MKLKLHNYKSKQLFIQGLKNDYTAPYDDTLIEKLKNIYDGGILASIILLSNVISNGHYNDRA